MDNWLKKETSCEVTPTTTSVTHIEMETAQNETKQTEAAPDDSSASASEEARGQTKLWKYICISRPEIKPESRWHLKFAHSDSKRKNALFSSQWFGRFNWLHYSPELNAI